MRRGACGPRSLAATRVGFLSYWAQTYYVTTVAVAGGALLFGAAARMRTRASGTDGTLLAAGAFLLAVSRPFEGFVIGLVAAAWILHGLGKASGELRRQLLAKPSCPLQL